MIKWHVILSKSDRKKIKVVLRSKKMSIETKKRAQILTDIDEADGQTPDSISTVMRKRGVSTNTVTDTRRKFAEGGIDAALFRKKRETPPVIPKVTGEVEAHIIAVACSGRRHRCSTISEETRNPSGYSKGDRGSGSPHNSRCLLCRSKRL